QENSNLDVNWVGLYSVCYTVTDPSGNTSNQVCRTIEIVENTTSVGDHLGKHLTRIYPNPSSGKFTIDFGSALEEDAELRITDVTGKEVYRRSIQALTESSSIDLTQLPGGVYLVRVQQGEQGVVIRLTLAK